MVKVNTEDYVAYSKAILIKLWKRKRRSPTKLYIFFCHCDENTTKTLDGNDLEKRMIVLVRVKEIKLQGMSR